ncbi:Mitochondrial carrier domain [Pseudocohnilembus persalinus]|uniref:Mitochondrial carrier domain n=1 Tax=Pseudocohnilembus persalinus TaxID=266149 RepID=A0A0V0QL78_PSEPJ|nr:Mitochondrial carrier domain [Pseudocohnilembus persalinus]|eukprot:KRX02709.1 Mitochondrial carrier domain [Pseudocohnilembus persalinus]
MQPHINDMSNFSVLKKIAFTGALALVPEIITSPLERLKVRCYARQKYSTSSLFHYKETGKIFSEIITKEKNMGLMYGFKGCLDFALTQIICRFLVYDFVIGRSSDDEMNGIERRYRFSDIFFATICSSTIGAIVSQPSEVLKIKVQLEPLGENEKKFESYREKTQNIIQYHNGNQSVLFMPGLWEKILHRSCFFMTEVMLFFQMRKMLKLEENYQEGVSQSLQYASLAGCASVLATIINQPLEMLYHRQVFRYLSKAESWNGVKYLQVLVKNEGLSGLYKGILPCMAKNGLNNFALMFIMQKFLTYEGNDLRRRKYDKDILKQGYKRGNL